MVGAGAAGLYAAIQIADQGLRCVLLERKTKTGAKILMSGGTRCNVTNYNPTVADYASEQPRIVSAILKQYRSDEVIQFFSSIGVEFELEDDGRMYPATHKARTVLEALLGEVHKRNILIMNDTCIEDILCDSNEFTLINETLRLQARSVILASGGLSFPTTGSDGIGLRIVKKLGHRIVETTPSLVPLLSKEAFLYQELAGVSCRVAMICRSNGKIYKQFVGSMLFTHKGISGPVVLNVSRFWLREKDSTKQFEIDFFPDYDDAELQRQFLEESVLPSGYYVKSILEQAMPKKLAHFLMRINGLEADLKSSAMTKQERAKLMCGLKHHAYPVSTSEGYARAEVTAGGVDLTEIEHTSMESKKIPRLFLIGEILDADGRIGGFNFHWAWATAATAAKGVAKCLK